MKSFAGIMAVFLVGLVGCFAPDKPSGPSIPPPPGVTAFLASNPQCGDVREVEQLHDWAWGRVYRITTTVAPYLFYFDGEELAEVKAVQPDGIERRSIFKKEIQTNFENISRPGDNEVPPYTLLTKMRLLNGTGWYADVLVPSLSRKTPAAERERIMRIVAYREKFSSGTLYCTREAEKANFDEEYSKAHPSALKQGLLGSFENGVFATKK